MENTNIQVINTSYMSPTIAELAKALSKAQGQFDHAKKEVKNEFFKSKYADLASVIDAAKKPLADNGLAVIQVTEIDKEKTILITKLVHISGEWICGRYPLNPIKADMQGMGSALTYARRYTFSAITGIASEDDDGNMASDKHDNSPVTGTVSAKGAYGSSKAMKDKWKEIASSFTNCPTIEALNNAWHTAKADMATMSSIDRQLYDSLVEIAQQRRNAINSSKGDEIQGRDVPPEEGGLTPEELAAEARLNEDMDRMVS